MPNAYSYSILNKHKIIFHLISIKARFVEKILLMKSFSAIDK